MHRETRLSRRGGRPLLLAALAALGAAPAGAGGAVEAPISAVTVDPGGAVVERRTGAIPDAGGRRWQLAEPVPASASAITATLEGGGAVLGVTRQEQPPEGHPAATERERLKGEIEGLEAERRALVDARKTAEQRIAYLEGLSPEGIEDRPGTWGEAVAGLARAMADARDDRRAAAERIGALEQRLAELREARDALAQGTFLVLDTSAGTPDEATLRVRYRVDAASWQPRYAARLDTAAERITLERRARIRQSTGEAWQGAEVTLTTASSAAYAEPPPLTAWRLRLAPNDGPRPLAGTEQGASPDTERMQAAPDGAQGRAPGDAASVTTSALDARFRLEEPVTVPDGGVRHARLAADTAEAALGAYTVPAERAEVDLLARLALPGEAAYPGGPVTLYRDGSRIGTTQLKPQSAGTPVTWSFGAMPGMAIERTREADIMGEAGWLNRDDRVQRQFRLTVTNRQDAAYPVAVAARTPVAGHEAIEIHREARPAPSGTLPDWLPADTGEPGIQVWLRTLEPGASWVIEHGYEITYPEGRSLRGL